MAKIDTYQAVTDKVLSLMEEHGSDWAKPWAGFAGSAPVSMSTGKPYTGINRLLLAFAPFSDYRWGTYKAWQEKGAQVRKGEKGTMVVFWKMLESREKDKDTGEARKIPMLRHYTVFNADQVEGAEPLEPVELPNLADRLVSVDAFIKSTGAVINTGDAAYYAPGPDAITMPAMEAFKDTEAGTATEHYYSTLLHELTHWSGAKHRLDRLKSAAFGSSTYAREELVAELGAAFLCTDLGISKEPRADHAKYLNSWLEALKDDKRLIVNAAAAASKACDYLNSLQPE